MWRRSAQFGGQDQTERLTAYLAQITGGGVCLGVHRKWERQREVCVARKERLCISEGGGGCMKKINSEKGRETMCLNKEGGGGVKRRWNILGEVYKSCFVMEPESKINNFGSATLVIFYTFFFG